MSLSHGKSNNYILQITIVSILTGSLSGIAFYLLNPWLGWIAFLPLLLFLHHYKLTRLQAVLSGFLSFFIQGVLLFTWTITIGKHYTGGISYPGIVANLLFSLVYSIKGGLLIFVYHFALSRTKNTLTDTLSRVLCFASTMVLIEWLYTVLFLEMPWIMLNIGYTQVNSYLISQWAELGGVWILIFFAAVINAVSGEAMIQRSYRLFAGTVILILLLHGFGWLRLKMLPEDAQKEITVSLICDNTPPEVRWNEAALNEYVKNLLRLNQQALADKPDLIIWNENVLPWSFRPDDDFLTAILKPKDAHCPHLISYATETGEDQLYNSAYLIGRGGNVLGRYDKQQLLGGLEEPLWNIQGVLLPFFNTNTQQYMRVGPENNLIRHSELGGIGVMICNESLTDFIAAKHAAAGAGFLVVLANDNWFADSYLKNYHFCCSRLRAIENRKDLVMNANLGISGIIRHSGHIQIQSQAKKSIVLSGTISPRNESGHYPIRKSIFILINFILWMILSIKRIREKQL